MNFDQCGQGRGSWTVSKNIKIQLLKSILLKDNIITTMSFLRAFVKPVVNNLVSKDSPVYLPTPFSVCAFPVIWKDMPSDVS